MASPLTTFRIFGVNISCALREHVLNIPLQWALQDCKRTVFYVNAHCLNISIEDPEYRATLNAADLVYSDGISVVWAVRYFGGCTLQKVTGRDWIHDFCGLARQNNLRLYILAGQPRVASAAKNNLINQYQGLQIVGTHPGFLNDKANSDLIAEINSVQPHVLLVGMGTPRQEKWLADHRHQIDAPLCWAVGALFDYVAGVEPPVPPWLNRLNLEWLWRMFVDPGGKWRRYLIGNPKFLIRILNQKLR